MPVTVFHVSTKVYVPSQVIAVPPGVNTEFHQRLVASGDDQAEARLEVGRPQNAQTRLTTQYAFDDIFDCWNYGMKQYEGHELHYYRAEMENPTIVPMALVDVIKKVAGATPAQMATLVAEYWMPTLNWQVMEYLSGSMRIIEELPQPTDVMEQYAATYRYGTTDAELAKAFCSATLAGKALATEQADGGD